MRFDLREPKVQADSVAADSALRARILDLLRARRPAPLSQNEIADSLKVKRSQVQAPLRVMEKEGEVIRPNGVKGGYSVPPSDGSAVAEVLVGDPPGKSIVAIASSSRRDGALLPASGGPA